MALTLMQAQTALDAWIAADLAVARGQSYSMNGRSLTLANTREIREQIQYWERRVATLRPKRLLGAVRHREERSCRSVVKPRERAAQIRLCRVLGEETQIVRCSGEALRDRQVASRRLVVRGHEKDHARSTRWAFRMRKSREMRSRSDAYCRPISVPSSICFRSSAAV